VIIYYRVSSTQCHPRYFHPGIVGAGCDVSLAMDYVASYLVEIGLMSTEYTMNNNTVQDGTMSVRVLMCDSVTEIKMPQVVGDDHSVSRTHTTSVQSVVLPHTTGHNSVMMYVFPTLAHAQESLALSCVGVLDLMVAHVLVCHLPSILTTLMASVTYGVATIPLSKSNTANTIAALEVPDDRYRLMRSSHVDAIRGDVVCMYHNSGTDALEMLGADYIYIIYIPYRQQVNPRDTLYILKTTDCITTVQCF
jgi:hypothetical protein